MRRYFLAKQDSRRDVDLRDYAQSIRDTVGKVLPNAEVVVTKQWYSVSPTPDKGAAIKIGRILSSKAFTPWWTSMRSSPSIYLY